MKRGRPSRTAIKVAQTLVQLGTKELEHIAVSTSLAADTERLLLESGAMSPGLLRLAKAPWVLRMLDRLERWTDTSVFEQVAQRKTFCERGVVEAIEAGATQVLVLGAGFDLLGWRLAPRFPNVRFLELDHPDTSRVKLRGIQALGPRPNLTLLARDLAAIPVSEVLPSVDGWRRDAQAVLVAEGLLYYLPPDAVTALFSDAAACAATGTRFLFTYFAADAHGRPEPGRWAGLMRWSFRLAGEPLRWGINPVDLPAFVGRWGWTIRQDECRVPFEHFAVATLPGVSA